MSRIGRRMQGGIIALAMAAALGFGGAQDGYSVRNVVAIPSCPAGR